LLFDALLDFMHHKFVETNKKQKNFRSLINMVSFGVAPSIILFILLKNSELVQQVKSSSFMLTLLALIAPFTFAFFVAIRLSKSVLMPLKECIRELLPR
jgi:phosphatidylserine synthase